MTLEEQQEINLHRNWKTRKATAQLIGAYNSYQFYECRHMPGARIYYITYSDIPDGNVTGYDERQNFLINSTYLSSHVRRKGICTMLYKTIMTKVADLVSDHDRSEGAEALWQRLMRDPDLSVVDNGANCFIGSFKPRKGM